MKINIFKIKEDKKLVLLNWGKEVKSRNSEARASLHEENCLEESFRIFELFGSMYLVGAMCAYNFKLGILNPNPNSDINKEHFKILSECIEYEIEQDFVYSVRAYDL